MEGKDIDPKEMGLRNGMNANGTLNDDEGQSIR